MLPKKRNKLSQETKNKISEAHKKRKEILGYGHTIEARQKMSENRKGKKLSKETRDKMKLSARRGINNNQWKGGITPIHLKIRNCDKNIEWKNKILERDHYKCVLCGQKGELHVDHFPVSFSIILNDLAQKHPIEDIYEKAQNYELFWDISNGRALCVPCHFGRKHTVKRKKRDVNLLTYNGETKSLVEWCKLLGIPHRTAYARQERGLSVDLILSTETLIRKKDNIVMVNYNGEIKPITVWSKIFGINSKLARRRIVEFKWSPEKAFFYPNRQRKYNNNVAVPFIKKCKRSTKKRGERIKMQK